MIQTGVVLTVVHTGGVLTGVVRTGGDLMVVQGYFR